MAMILAQAGWCDNVGHSSDLEDDQNKSLNLNPTKSKRLNKGGVVNTDNIVAIPRKNSSYSAKPFRSSNRSKSTRQVKVDQNQTHTRQRELLLSGDISILSLNCRIATNSRHGDCCCWKG